MHAIKNKCNINIYIIHFTSITYIHNAIQIDNKHREHSDYFLIRLFSSDIIFTYELLLDILLFDGRKI